MTWWRHQLETFSAWLALCAGNSPVPVNSPHKGQWRGALMFSLICVWINGWVNNREAGDLRRHRGHYDVIVMKIARCLKRCLRQNLTYKLVDGAAKITSSTTTFSSIQYVPYGMSYNIPKWINAAHFTIFVTIASRIMGQSIVLVPLKSWLGLTPKQEQRQAN